MSDNKPMNDLLRAAAGYAPPDDDDAAEEGKPNPGSADGGYRGGPRAPGPNMNEILRKALEHQRWLKGEDY